MALAVGAVSGALIPPALFAGDPVRMLVTFLGLVSASILPTISLAIGSMSGTGRSVQKINTLFIDITESTKALFRTLMCVGIVFAALVIFSMIPEVDFRFVALETPYEILDAPRRFVQIIIFASAITSVEQAILIPKTFYKVLKIKHEIAVFETRKEVTKNAPTETDIKNIFPTKDGFGQTVSVEKLKI